MSFIPPTAAAIKPAAIYPFFDKVQTWLREPADKQTIAKLRRQCGHLYADNRAARFGQGYRQRIELKQPGKEALCWIAGQPDALINRVEVALDLIFEDPNKLDDAFEFLHRHLIRRWHGKTQKIKLVRRSRDRKSPEIVEEVEAGQTRYDAWRAPNKIAFYRSPFSRVTGELNCLHVEWHLNNVGAARSAGIHSGKDLLRFDHRQFWGKRMLLVYIEAERLGRLIRNHHNAMRSRTPEIGPFGKRMINLDSKKGGIVLRAYGTLQELLDEYGSALRLQRVMTPIDNDAFLPDAERSDALLL